MWIRVWLATGIGVTFAGLLGHPWQHFELSDLRTAAMDHATGQVVLYMAVATAVLLAAALPARRAIWRWPALVVAWLTLGSVLTAPFFADAGLQLLDAESVQLVVGHDLALLGSLCTALGALLLAARDPLAPAHEPWVHLEVSWRDRPLIDRWFPPARRVVVGQEPGLWGIELPSTTAPRRHAIVVPTREGPALVAHGSATTTYEGEIVAFNAEPSVLHLGQAAVVEWDDVRVQCTLERMPRPIGRSPLLVDERLAAAILVSAVLQVLFIIYATLSWTETADRTVMSSRPKTTHVGAIVRQVYHPR